MKQELSSIRLAELITTRISHDVIGNVGAVSNAVELLEDGDMSFLEDIKNILKVSSTVLSSRLKFFRLAFGLDNANTESMEYVKETAKSYLKTVGNSQYPIDLEFNLDSARYAKAILASIMIAADTFIRGGKIIVGTSENRVFLKTTSENKLSEDKIAHIRSILNGDDVEPNAQYAAVYYLIFLLRQEKINLYVLNSASLEFIFE